jgi:hypothetical protein
MGSAGAEGAGKMFACVATPNRQEPTRWLVSVVVIGERWRVRLGWWSVLVVDATSIGYRDSAPTTNHSPVTGLFIRRAEPHRVPVRIRDRDEQPDRALAIQRRHDRNGDLVAGVEGIRPF